MNHHRSFPTVPLSPVPLLVQVQVLVLEAAEEWLASSSTQGRR